MVDAVSIETAKRVIERLFAGVDQASLTQPGQHQRKIILTHRKAALAAPQLALHTQHIFAYIVSRMDDNGALFREIVGGIKAHQPLRTPMLANIFAAGQIGPV